MNTPTNLLVFCGSKPGKQAAYIEACEHLAEEMKQRNYSLVYGGGKVGIMGAIADACLERDLHVTGIIPTLLKEKELAHPGIQDCIEVDTMHTRKHLMFEMSDAIVALPGGIGTIEEWIEVMTWKQLAIHNKPLAFLNINGYWDKFIDFLEHACEEGFLDKASVQAIICEPSAKALMDKIEEGL